MNFNNKPKTAQKIPVIRNTDGSLEASIYPFIVKRVYWCYNTPSDHIRGNHANIKNEQILISIKGSTLIELESASGEISKYNLSDPTESLYIPPLHWRKIKQSQDAILLCLASEDYDEYDYIRDYDVFKRWDL